MAGTPAPLLLVCFLLQVFSGIVAGIGVWRRASWAAGAVVLLGASIAITALVEGFVLWIVAYLFALAEAVLALALALMLAAWVRRAE
jgi:hypothetical protein